MIVTDIAKESFVGRTANLVGRDTGPGHFQRVMSNIGTTLLVLYVYPPVAETILRSAVYSRVIIWLSAVWIGGFFRDIKLATPKDNNLLDYALIFLVRTVFHRTSMRLRTSIVYRSLAFRLGYPASQPQLWP